MAEYILTPEMKQQPSAFELLEALHRRGMRVEIQLKGEDRQWESIRFSEPGPPEIECFLSHDRDKETYSVFVSQDSPAAATELQVFLVDALLQGLGGQADNLATRERFTPMQFALKIQQHHNPKAELKELLWIGFSWAVVALASGIYFIVASHLRQLVMLVLILSFLSAVLQTYAHYKNQ